MSQWSWGCIIFWKILLLPREDSSQGGEDSPPSPQLENTLEGPTAVLDSYMEWLALSVYSRRKNGRSMPGSKVDGTTT